MQRLIKRLCDIIVAAVLAVLFIPIFLIVSLLIKIDSKGPVFFIQDRPGKDGKGYNIIKFRTMRVGSQGKYPDITQRNPNITRIGHLLRRLHVDEAPQVINILKGEMSLVGPRPPMFSEVDFNNDFELKRFLMKPGMAGWAQINGGNNISWQERVACDVWYVENWSLWLDFKIFLIAIWKILILGRGLYKKQ